jgi:hypothetical protein
MLKETRRGSGFLGMFNLVIEGIHAD